MNKLISSLGLGIAALCFFVAPLHAQFQVLHRSEGIKKSVRPKADSQGRSTT
jgi:hypothetical protein